MAFSAKIREATKTLSARERILIKDTQDAKRLDTLTKEGEVIIDVEYYAILDIHNDRATDSPDYTQYVIVDRDGTRYVTGSESFFSAFKNIYDEMTEEGEEFAVRAYRLPSKNREGKDFITCSLE